MVKSSITIDYLSTVILIILCIQIGNMTSLHNKASGISFRIRVCIYKYVANFATSQTSRYVCTNPQVSTVLKIAIAFIAIANFIASDRTRVHFKHRVVSHIDATNITRSSFTTSDGCAINDK